MTFYQVLADDSRYPNRWFLDEPRTEDGQLIDAREFRYGRPYQGPIPANVPVQQNGKCVAFNLAAFDMPVVVDQTALNIQQCARDNVQCFPVVIDQDRGGFQIVNAVARVKCLDEARSEIMKWRPEDGRPDKLGCYRMVTNLRIDPWACRNKHIFRIEGWEIALIISHEIREAIETTADLGVVFAPVSP